MTESDSEGFDAERRAPRPPTVAPLPTFAVDVQAKADELLHARLRRQALTDWRSQMPVDFREAQWPALMDGCRDNDERSALASLDRFCSQPRSFLVLIGEKGTGKSFAACAVAHRLADERGWFAKFWPVTEFFTELKTFGERGHTALTHASNVNVLVLDDLGSGRAALTDYEADQLNALLNRRWMEHRPTIITSNLTKDDFKSVVGQRIADRLLDGHPPVQFVGATRRGVTNATAGR